MKGYKRKMLGVKVFLLFIAASLMLDVLITGIGYIMYTRAMNTESLKICTGISEAIASTLNPNRVDDWLKGKRLSSYDETKEQLSNLLNSYSDIVNIRVYKMQFDKVTVIYDMPDGKILGENAQYNGSLAEMKGKLIQGEYIDAFVNKGEKATVTALTPVTDTSNRVTCYAICEISMETMEKNCRDFIKTLSVAVLFISLIPVILFSVFLGFSVLTPISELDSRLRKAAAGEGNMDEATNAIKGLKCRGIKELENMRDDFSAIIEDIAVKTNEADEFDKIAREKMKRAAKIFSHPENM